MGQQQVGRMPESREALYDEWRRVLHWSAEVIARVDDNILEEDSFLLDYDNTSIAAKVDEWLLRFVDHDDVQQTQLQELANDVKYKMRKRYDEAYTDLRRFTKIVDDLAENQRSIHKKILDLEKIRPKDAKKFRRKFGRLRIRVFKNLRSSEKMTFRDRRLKKQFIIRVFDIDRESKEFLEKKVNKLMEKK